MQIAITALKMITALLLGMAYPYLHSNPEKVIWWLSFYTALLLAICEAINQQNE